MFWFVAGIVGVIVAVPVVLFATLLFLLYVEGVGPQ